MWKSLGLLSLSFLFAVLIGCGGSSGTPTGTPGATLSVTSLGFPTTTVSMTATAMSATLTNSGTASLAISGVALGGTSTAAFALSANSCSGSLAAGASCAVAVTFSPPAAGTYTATLTFTDNAPGGSQMLALSGTAVATAATLSVTSLTFPNTAVSVTAAAMSATLTNSGTAALVISGVALGGTATAAFALTANSCSGTIAVGASCAVSVTFTPPAATVYSAMVTFTDNAPGGSQVLALSGTGQAPGALFSVSSLAFPNTNVGSTAAAMSTTLTNNGVATLTISGITLAGTNPGDFAISANTCGSTLAVGASCTVSVTFMPLSSMAFAATLNFADTAAVSPQMVQLSGTGVAPLVALSPTTLTFPNTVISSDGNPMSVTLTSSGTAPSHLNSLTVTGANPADFTATSNCVNPIAPGSTCTISVKFSPAAVGASSATLNVADNAANSPQLVTLSGTGISVPSQNTCTTLHTTSPAQPTPTTNYAGTAFSGTVMAGSTPVLGASVQVYAAGTSGNGSAPTAMLLTPLITDTNGKFSVPATFTCPYSSSVLYAVATGGQAGSGGVLNTGIELMSVLGVCNTLTNNASYVINEATTVAGVYAMAQFMKPGAQMGATSTNGLGIGLAAATAANLVNVTTGAQPGAYFPSTGTAPTAKIDTLANALNGCVVSSAASVACTSLYAYTGSATNTLDAALSIAQNQGENPAGLYALGIASGTYSPVLTAAPADWTMIVTYLGASMNDPTTVSIDSTGKVWVGNYFDVASYFSNTGVPLLGYANPSLQEVYGGTVDYNDHMWFADEQTNDAYNGNANNGNGAIAVVNTSGAVLAGYLNGGIYFPLAVAMDLSGNGWVADYGNPNAGVVVLTNAGVPVSGASGYSSSQFDFPAAVATDSKCNAYVANQSSNTITKVVGDGSSFTSFAVGAGPSGVAVDTADNVWSANYYASTVGLLLAAGAVPSGSAGYSGGGINHPQGIAVDSKGTAWIANFRGPALTELSGAGNQSEGTVLSPSAGWAPDSGAIEAFALAIDPSGNIWVTDFGQNALSEYIGMAAPVKTPLLGPVRVP